MDSGRWELPLTLMGRLLLNPGNDAVIFPVAGGTGFKIFAADFDGQMFVPGSSFTVTVNFTDGSSAAQTVTCRGETDPPLKYELSLHTPAGKN